MVDAVAACRLLLLGPPLVQRDGRATPIRLHKGLALAAYLAVERRSFSRDHLATMLWPDLGQHGALANLRHVLTFLRETLGGGSIDTDGDLVGIASAAVGVDLVDFRSLASAHRSEPDLGALEAAAALYRGPFLEGFSLGDCLEYDEWQDGVRRKTEEQLDGLLATLCGSHLRAGRPASALPFARRWLDLDPVNEAAHRSIMEIHAREGRPDLARRQYTACARTLQREGLAPEQQTRDLHAAIARHRLDRTRPSDDRAPVRTARRRRRRWIIAAAATILVIGSIVLTYLTRRYSLGSDLSVAVVEPVVTEGDLSRLRIGFRNDGMGLPRVRYAIAFSSDESVVQPRDYVVFEDEFTIGLNGGVTSEVDRVEMEKYIAAHSVRIPPGTYSPTVIIDPEDRLWEDSRANNRLTSGTRFFFAGNAPEAAFVVDVSYRGSGTLDSGNPLKLFIGNGSYNLFDEGGWGRFVVSREGTCYLPVEDVPYKADGESGYVLVAIHDVKNDLASLAFPGPGDEFAIYTDRPGNLSYGMCEAAGGAAVYPGRRYRIEFSPPPPPAPDTYENDDHREIATIIDPAALPVRQRHTFHDEGTGDLDWDWFQMALGAGETLTVETYSAGGAWECDTAIDLSDSEHFITQAKDKSEMDLYSRLAFTNTTGARKLFYILVKPYDRYATGISRFADYLVEFRR
jgi:DNA-binding SARP family transcriptional activator